MDATDVFLSLGSNLGDRAANLGGALEMLLRSGVLEGIRCSSAYETEPVDVPDQGDFLNLVCGGTTRLGPHGLLQACQDIERLLGRETTRNKGPRLIDLDILLFGDLVLHERKLTVPHAALRNRRFVLVPLAELAPQAVDPVTGLTTAELLIRCTDQARVTALGPLPYFPSNCLSASANRSPRSR